MLQSHEMGREVLQSMLVGLILPPAFKCLPHAMSSNVSGGFGRIWTFI